MFLKVSRNFLKTFSLFVLSFLVLAAAASALAATNDYVPLVQIPNVDTGNFLNYLRDIYNFLISIVGILAMASLVYGGFRYLTSVGNPAAVEDAKDIINSAIVGLVLALSSWLILNEINPDVLVTSRKPGITGTTDKYAYNQLNRACVADSNLDGVQVTGTTDKKCRCVDNPDKDVIVKNRTSTKITLPSPADGSSAAVGTSVTFAGKLTDVNGTPIRDVKPVIYVIYSGADGSGAQYTSNPTTDINGNYSFGSTVSTNCSATVKLQAYFEGNDTYAPSVSSPVAFTATGTPACTKTNFPSPVKDFSGGYLCQNACSDPDAGDGKYHCLKADLRVGTSPHPIGKEVTISIAKKERVYMDARSNSRDYAYSGLNLSGDPYVSGSGFENGIDRYEINYSSGAGLIADYAQSDGSACSWIAGTLGRAATLFWNVAGIDDWSESDPNRIPFIGSIVTPYPYTTAKKYTATLWVQGKSGGSACGSGYKDTVIVNVIP